MRKLLLGVMLLISTGVYAQKATNFTGTYTINKSKISFGAAPEGVLPKGYEVTQTVDQIAITTIPLTGAENTNTPKLDGTLFTRELPDGGKATVVLKLSADKSGFGLDKKAFTATGDANGSVKETWSLEDGGKTLKVIRDVAQSNGMNFTIIGYYDKSN